MRRAVGTGAALFVLLASRSAFAAKVDVTNVAELRAAITAAKAGDEIVLASGTYSMDDISCGAAGTAAAPIVVRSQTPLGAKIELTGVEGFKVVGPHWRFEDLEVRGKCASDMACEHAFHVSGKATFFVLRGNKLVDFNAQLKVNATQPAAGAPYDIPHDGLVEYNEIFDTHARNTNTPVTKLNIDTGDRWVVRANFIHDFFKASGDTTYGTFMKSGGKAGVYERNLVVCKKDLTATGSQIGLSFGGGGTGNQFCAPAFDAGVPCSVEHDGGTMRNNIVASCSDVGIYLNRAKSTKLLHNTLIGTTGIDFRFDTSSGEARGNVVSGPIRTREGATPATQADNLLDVSQATFDAMYVAPLAGDLKKKGDLGALLGKVAAGTAGVTDDYCARTRATPFDLGALQGSLGDCTTTFPPRSSGTPGGPGTDGGTSGASSGTPGQTSSGGEGTSGGSSGGGASPTGEGASGDDSGCAAAPASPAPSGASLFAAAAVTATSLLAARRRRREKSLRG